MSSIPGEELGESGELSHEEKLKRIAESVQGIADTVSDLSAAVEAEMDGADPFTHDQRAAVRGLGHTLKLAREYARNLLESLPPLPQP